MHSLRVLTALAAAALLGCHTFHIERRVPASGLLANQADVDRAVPLSPRTYERVPLLTMERETARLCLEATGVEMPPSIVFAVGDDQGIILERAFGFSRLEGGRPQPATLETMYDLASLTKVIATTTAIMQLVDRGLVDLDAPVVRYLPEYANHGKEAITVRQCLTHTAGFHPFYRLWEIVDTPEEARAHIENCELDSTPGTRYVYSDVGFLTLGWIVERVTGQPLDAYCQQSIWTPLGMTSTMFNPPETLRPVCAATENDQALGRGVVQGQVHDENAAFLGGVAGHAGLFSTASDLSRFAIMILRGGEMRGRRVLSEESVREMTRAQITLPDTDGDLTARALGWWSHATPAYESTMGGQGFSASAFGHTGYTGPAIQIDPERRLFAVFLCNRLHARQSQAQMSAEDWRADTFRRMRPVRAEFFNIVSREIR